MQKRIDAQRYPRIEGVLERMARSGNDGNYRVAVTSLSGAWPAVTRTR